MITFCPKNSFLLTFCTWLLFSKYSLLTYVYALSVLACFFYSLPSGEPVCFISPSIQYYLSVQKCISFLFSFYLCFCQFASFLKAYCLLGVLLKLSVCQLTLFLFRYASGSTTRPNTAHDPCPSMRAASINCLDCVRNAARAERYT